MKKKLNGVNKITEKNSSRLVIIGQIFSCIKKKKGTKRRTKKKKKTGNKYNI